MHRIVFTGTQGVGKTTILKEMEKQGYTVITEVVRNLAKSGVKINKDGDEKSQTKIFKEYEKLLSNIDVKGYFSDRSLVDVTAYTIYLSKHGKVSKEFADKQVKKLKKFRVENPDVTYCYFPIEFDIVDDGVRSLDEEFRTEVDSIIKELLKECGITPIVISGSVEERVDKMTRVHNWLTEGMKLFIGLE